MCSILNLQCECVLCVCVCVCCVCDCVCVTVCVIVCVVCQVIMGYYCYIQSCNVVIARQSQKVDCSLKVITLLLTFRRALSRTPFHLGSVSSLKKSYTFDMIEKGPLPWLPSGCYWFLTSE